MTPQTLLFSQGSKTTWKQKSALSDPAILYMDFGLFFAVAPVQLNKN